MSDMNGSLVIRDARDDDANAIVSLFIEGGENPYGWNEAKWRHYYRDYPEGEPVSLVAEMDGLVVGHYGMLPIRIGVYPAMLGLHAYVSTSSRGIAVISALMKEVDVRCRSTGIALICGFANPKFSFIKKTLFKWDVPLWLGFKKDINCSDLTKEDRCFFFEYSDAWYKWRFGEDKDIYFSKYKDSAGIAKKQLLKNRLPSSDLSFKKLEGCEAWSPNLMFSSEQKDFFCQPFQIKVFDKSLIEKGVSEVDNWFVEMGDSDTFQYNSWGK